MFGDACFSEVVFADFFPGLPSSISYTFRKGRTVVVAIIPSNGEIVTGIVPRYLRTSVQEILPSTGHTITYLDDRIIRTNVTAIKSRSNNPKTGI